MNTTQKLLKLILTSKTYSADPVFREQFYRAYQTYLLAEPSTDTHIKFLTTLFEIISNISEFKTHEVELQNEALKEVDRTSDVQITPYSGCHPFIEKIFLHENGLIIGSDVLSSIHLNKDLKVSVIKLNNQIVIAINQNLYGIATSLGKGKFGEVYLAQDLQSGELCVIKKMAFNHSSFKHSELRNIFTNEEGVLQELNELKISAIDEKADIGFIVMKLAPGIQLASLKDNPTHAFIWFTRFISMLENLSSLHEKHILHGDISLENMLCDIDNEIHFIDKGLSKRTPHSGKEKIKFTEQDILSHSYQSLAKEVRYKHTLTPKTEVCIAGYAIADLLDLLETSLANSAFKSLNSAMTAIKKLNLSAEASSVVISYLAKMTADAKKLRPTLSQAIKEFRELRAAYASEIVARFVKTGFVSLEEILPDKDQSMLTALLLMDQVYILIPKNYNESIYPLLNRLSKSGVRIAGFASSHNEMHELNMAESTHAELMKSNRLLMHTSFFITKEKKVVNEELDLNILNVSTAKHIADYRKEIQAAKITPEQFLMVTDELFQELLRLETKYPAEKLQHDYSENSKAIQTRKEKIITRLGVLTTQYSVGNLTMNGVINELNDIQKVMTHHSRIKRGFATLFSMEQKSEGAKNISRILENLTAPVSSIKMHKKN